ncbi:hypothetical protein BT67DRAFT_457176 [Trichocladium antarcticum]|uniref:Uncharacterized protein n=1 Tax=Trichocladium antarcticum TaxID=1450529 RepID=A0AAN6ZB81_9PEZI|nr:hypothetical protein BT67DRAFT_457176 [Trichocladium antarcticum]
MGKERTEFSLAGFARIAPSIYIQDPQLNTYDADHGTNSSQLPLINSFSSLSPPSGPAANLSRRRADTPPPDLIILTSWTGAASKHVAKYTAAYNNLYPGVPILLITTALSDLCLRSTKTKLAALAPAITYLLSPSHSPTAAPRFAACLLHAFSEGGAHKAVLLARAYLAATTITTRPQRLPVAAFLLDSTPGCASYRRARTAFARALPGHQDNAVGRALAAGVVGAAWLALKGRSATAGRRRQMDGCGGGRHLPSSQGEGHGDREGGQDKRDFIAATRRALNDEALWAVRGVPRTYLFGEADEVVWWRDVHRHAVESARRGGTSDGQFGCDGGLEAAGTGTGTGSLMVRFQRTAHCAHAKGIVNGRLYWAAVRQTWDAREDGGLGMCLGLGRRLSLDSLCLVE